MLIHWSCEHLLAKPILYIKDMLVVDDGIDFVRDELPHFLHHIYHFKISIHLIRTLLMTCLGEVRVTVESFDYEKAMSHKIVHVRSGYIIPERFLVSVVIISSFELHDLIHRHV